MKYELDGQEGEELATFGAGCYWGTEKYFVTQFQKKFPGCILGQAVGFMSPNKDAPANPRYRQVCEGKTGHVEVLHLRFDSNKVSYEQLVKYFFTFHDPTTLNQQGNDRGSQYASVIFFHSPEQRKVAEMVKEQVQHLIIDGKIP
mmetsp:Transcript_14402/g.24543  ORF Transcript_14402/g.24543 Transcript_14402/m.24543 type:complete len:145 (+) Transcript_14402:174-608(+)|eukprot:CAMPEP_0168618628 /NCGR_PEP_ID=MMETSP0449_2-20121227/6170_1 /TAXON_ID=1082188 /ORGANISM="Strombidium rassoulzadegani, Strain ras09" /LENGTH=144 /DNA_ID=CAMNT_0008659509 /DNA_START=151 /DNA_END=585 /DNA_ORIENTATION=+